MNDGTEDATAGARTAATWKVEVAVAGLLAGVAVLVMADSWRVGIGWGAEGPRSGFFPFYVGLILLAAATATIATSLAPAAGRDRSDFVPRRDLGRVLAVLAPTIVFVVAANWIGLYVAATLLIAFFMRLHGPFPLLPSLGLGAAIALVLFAVFEIWFLMPLPKGPLEAALGF